MKIEILCAGHTPKPHEERWIDEYVRRSRKFAPIHLTRIKERSGPSLEQAKEKTWLEIKKKIPKQSWRVALDPRGRLFTTPQFGCLLQQAERAGKKTIAFLIGGSCGFPTEATESADSVMSLTPLTLPHRIALLVLCEQIYRVLSWKAGAPYHHE